jgi:hypothetical protein
MKTFKLVNELEMDEAKKLVDQWMKDGGNILFSTSKDTARKAITEFILNQRDLTCYEGRRRKETNHD